MLSYGIIWNSAHQFSDKIIEDIGSKNNIVGYFDIDLGNRYSDFVNDIYSSENMEQYKIDKKISHMNMNSNTTITVVLFEFNGEVIEYHPFKKKNVYKELEDLKVQIREKYKEYVDNYTFDIIFHATDDSEELKKCNSVLLHYLDESTYHNEKTKLMVKSKKLLKTVENNEK